MTARLLGRDPSTISRELWRDAATRGGKLEYLAGVIRWEAELLARRPKMAKLVSHSRVHDGRIRRLGWVIGPRSSEWRGWNNPHWQGRLWAMSWSPERIARRLGIDYPDGGSMRFSREAIY